MINYQKSEITVFQSAIFKMNSAVVNTNDLILVVDPGYLPNEIKEIRQFVETIKQDKPIFLFFTHSDFDHIVGNGAFPDAITIASRQFTESSLKNKQVQDIIRFDDELYIDRDHAADYPIISRHVVSNGQELRVGNTLITFFQAFGHTDDGLFAVMKDKNLLLAGDYLSDLEFPFIYHSFQEYEHTLNSFKRIIRDNGSLILVPGHGSVTEDEKEIQQRIKVSEEYLLLVKNDHSDAAIKSFINEKGYSYQTNLLQRHQENLKLWNEIKNNVISRESAKTDISHI